jgi:RNA polymerase sigma-70 factor (ECF subfamily)
MLASPVHPPLLMLDSHPSVVAPAFEAVYREHFSFVWRVLSGMGVPPGAVEDAAQEVFVVVLRRLPEFEPKASVKTWLYEIAMRVASNARRSVRRRGLHEELDEQLEGDAPGPAEVVESRRALSEVLSVLDTMDDSLRSVLVLSQFEQMTAPEIAALTNVKVNTVSSRLRRARQVFQQVLSQRKQAAP